MRYRSIMFLLLWLFAAAALAQSPVDASATPAQSDQWNLPAAPSPSVDYRRSATSRASASTESPFRFGDSHPGGPADQAPPSAMDRAAVLGTDRPWAGGRPPVDCALTPHAPTC
jgi:hypothetical protein